MIDFGVAIFPTDSAIQPAEVARAAEERGFESLFFPEHTHIPASRETPFPPGGEMPPEYWHMHDPFVALAARRRQPRPRSGSRSGYVSWPNVTRSSPRKRWRRWT